MKKQYQTPPQQRHRYRLHQKLKKNTGFDVLAHRKTIEVTSARLEHASTKERKVLSELITQYSYIVQTVIK